MHTTIDSPEPVIAQESLVTHLNLTVLQRYSRYWMTFILGFSDLICLGLSGILAIVLKSVVGQDLNNPGRYLGLAPMLIVFLGIYAWRGLYPAVGLSPVEELRRLTVSTSVVFLLVTAFTFWVRTAEDYSRVVFALAWIFALVFVQAGRWLVRIIAVRVGLWGEPVAIVGNGPQGRRMVKFLKRNFRFGLRPVVVVDGFDTSYEHGDDLPLLLLGDPAASTEPLRQAGIRTAVLITSEMPNYLQSEIVDGGRFGFKRLILMSDLRWIGSVGVVPYDLEGFVGLEVRQNLFSRSQQALKRTLDIVLVLVTGIFLLPFLIFIALLIRMDSPGSIFYAHKRIGKGGKVIHVWKFRTMVPEADSVLEAYLARHPELKAEWEATQKLRNDPRVTRIGEFLRKLSLDELPQLWNVLKGEMSLVGPRPIVVDEIKRYSQGFKLYQRVRPGLTGLWQVSGRNDVGYDSRVRFDKYYVRNWSIWLDVYILLRTFWVVIRRDGAY